MKNELALNASSLSNYMSSLYLSLIHTKLTGKIESQSDIRDST